MQNVNNLRYYSSSLEPIYQDFKELKDVSIEQKIESGDQQNLGGFKGHISFENVTFTYLDTANAALSDLNFTINKGERISFAGTTGSGKTTIIDLMLGFLKPDYGSVIIDGREIVENDPIFSHISYIPQSIFLVDDTLPRNIALGIPDDQIHMERVQQVIDIARLNVLTENLPNGLNTVNGERGIRLSGGERQRIGIARALYYDPDIIILDEATSALDSQIENNVLEAINGLGDDLTIILISHRTTVMTNCDRIYFIQNRKITDTDKLNELLKNNQDFRYMARLAL